MSKVIGGFVSLVILALITRSLGVFGFGQYATGIAYLSTFQILADLGLYSLLTKEISQKPEEEKELVGQFFTLRLIVAVFFMGLASVLVFLFPYSRELKLGIVFASSAFVLLSLSQLFMGVFQKYLQVYKAAIAELLGRAVQLGFVWFFFIVGGGLFHYLGAVIAGVFIIFTVDLVFVRGLVPFKLVFKNLNWRRIVKTTYPIAISIIFTLLYFKSDTLILSILKTQEDVGIYNVAYKVLEVLIFFPAAFFGLLLPLLSLYAKENKEKFSRLLSRLTELTFAVGLTAVVCGILLSYSIVNFIGGTDFLSSGLPLQILFIAVGIIFWATLLGNAVIALDLQKKAMWAYIAGFVFNFIANLIFIPRFSYIGASWTTVATELLVTVYLVWVIKKEQKFRVSFSVIARSALVALFVASFVFYATPSIQTPLGAGKFLAVFIGGLTIFAVFIYLFKLYKLLPKKLFTKVE
ncbi:MAG: hypothetical protein A3H51_01050 [Candidatus Spechtbacteria bacterium RIFCSPLOWO2_02_FULL_38_8]|uniref:Uncharacterized protein n=1 Tax=Candidatus Spechtbacteria bacterium RIFCSPLOWO2_02_FULL_38_8 TaxID=1802164 RepID=A0A1G2HKS3_9BACT|nr:MAG: hypothetical protein A3H51_01050 [Candidatus Spechtbacteria bacterium RIFCSPLOWO2_02_FULL_38_8]